MAVYGPDDFGFSGWDTDEAGNLVPKGTTLNTPPPEFATPQGGPLINTPNSSTGQPFRTDPSASGFRPPVTGSPNTLTPNSRSGAPAPGIRNLPVTQEAESGLKRFLPSLLRGGARIGAAANPVGDALQLVTPSDELAPPSMDEAPKWSWPQQTPTPVTVGGPGRSPSGPLPPGGQPPEALPPFTRGPVPPTLPPSNVPYPPPRPTDAAAPYPPPRPKGGGGRARGGGAAPGRAPPMVNLQPQPGWTTIDRPNADIVGGPTRPGQLSAAPREPGGPAHMGAFDFSTLFYHPAVAAAAAAHPAVQAAAAAPRARVRGPLAPGALGQNQGQGQQAPGPIDPTIVAGGPGAQPRQPGAIDPEIIARQRMRGGGRLPYTPEDMAY
jgi:hypothetical protein